MQYEYYPKLFHASRRLRRLEGCVRCPGKYRAEAGIHAKAYRNVDDPNNACAIGTAPTKEAFIAFSQQPVIQEAMKNAGVLAAPEFKFLEEA